MKNIKLIILLIIGLCLLYSTAASKVKSTRTERAGFLQSNRNFAIKFFKQLINDPENQGKGLIFSPLSIQVVGGLLFAGAEGKTAKEILHGFNLPGNDKESVNNAFSDYFSNNSNTILSSGNLYLANKFYIMNGYNLKSTFNDIAIQNYNSEIENIDFSDSENSAQLINNWVNDHTGGKIKDLVQSDAFDLMTRMYIVNVINFKGEWEDKFDASNTEESDFYVTPSQKIQIPMMRKTGQIEVKIFYDISAIGVNLKFKDSDLSLYILTTQNFDEPLNNLQNKLDTLSLSDLFEQTKEPYSVQLRMPKFKIELKTDLKTILKRLNINTMFGDEADFSNLLDTSEQVLVSDGIHKACIEIDEEGGEASAASGISITSRMGPMIVNIDHSFLYFIKTSDGEILFMGRFTGQ